MMERDDALELVKELLYALDEIDNVRAEEFKESIKEKAESIRDWILDHNKATDRQVTALENMIAGAHKWVRD